MLVNMDQIAKIFLAESSDLPLLFSRFCEYIQIPLIDFDQYGAFFAQKYWLISFKLCCRNLGYLMSFFRS